MTDYDLQKYAEMGLSAKINGVVIQKLPAVQRIWSNDLFLVSRPENRMQASSDVNVINEYFDGRFIAKEQQRERFLSTFLINETIETEYVIDEHSNERFILQETLPEQPVRRFLIDESTGTVYSAPRTSYGIRYADLCASIVKDTYRRVEFGSLGHEQSVDYALRDHNHDDVYSWLSAASFFPDKDEEQFWHIGTLRISSYSDAGQLSVSQTEFNCPIVKMPTFSDPDIGTMRFIAKNRLTSYPTIDWGGTQNVDIYADEFDGWVYPNGTTFTTEDAGDFISAKAAYPSTASQFTVPDLRHFVKCNPAVDMENPMRLTTFRNGFPTHSHQVFDLTCTGDLKLTDVQMRVGNTGEYSGSKTICGWGVADSYIGEIKTHVSGQLKNAKFSNLSTMVSDASFDIESKPTHNLMPVMVFIGRKGGD